MSRDERQQAVAQWCRAAFGEAQAHSPPQRAMRLVEEAVEAAQACGVSPDRLHALIDYVYGRPIGDINQELGGVGVTLLALADAVGHSADAEERREVERVLSKPLADFRRRNEEKNAAGMTAMLPKEG